jgi:ketosteroid isomerase-like protein
LLSEDIPGFGGLMAPDAVSTLEGVEGVVPFSGTYRGIDGVKSQAATFCRVARAVVANVVPGYVVDGNRICTRFDEDGTYVFSTKYPIYFTNLHCFAVNDAGQIETFRSYNDTWRVWVAFTGGEWRPARTSK